MRPEKLVLQAFGPYVTRQEIDFGAFSKRHLFLIRGETGSGKTMLLDGITFALYGKSSGGQRESMEAMRSRFAKEELDTLVEFTFSLHGRRYRFLRRVEARKKRTKETVWRSSVDAGEIIGGEFYPFFENPRLKNVEEKAQELLKLSYEQFLQVILLPQGSFERFLTSKSEEKQEILRTLFQMERWTEILQRMSEEVRKEKAELDNEKQRQRLYLESLKEESYDSAKVAWEALQQRTSSLQEQLQSLEKQQEELQEHIRKQQEAHRLQQEGKKVEEALQQMELQKEEIEEKQRLLARQRLLQQVLPYWQKAEEKRKACLQRRRQREEAEASLMLLQEEKEKEKERLQMIEQLQQEEERLNRLTKLFQSYHEGKNKSAELLQQLEKSEAALKELQRKKEKQEERKNVLEQMQEHLQQEKQALGKALEERESVLAAYVLYQKARPYADTLRQLKVQLAALDAQLLQQTKEAERKQKKLAAMRQEHETLYRLFLDSSALQLAQLLKEEAPCPVCGSLHHPSPAQGSGILTDVQTLRKKKQELDQQEEAFRQEKQAGELLQAEKRMKLRQQSEAQKQLDDLLHKPYRKEEEAAAVSAYQTLMEKERCWKERIRQEEALQKEKEQLHQTLNRLREAGEALGQEHVRIRSFYEQRKEELQQLEREIDGEQEQDVKERRKRCLGQQEHLQERIEAVRLQYAQQLKQQELSKLEEEKALKEQDRASAALYQLCEEKQVALRELQLIKEERELKAVEEELRQYELQYAGYTMQQEQLHRQMSSLVIEELPPLYERQAQQKEQIDKLRREWTAASASCRLYKANIEQLEKSRRLLQEREPRLHERLDFVRCLRGDQGIGIERYVLGVMLSSIISQANLLLKHVHNGRYQLYRSDEAAGRTRKSGLEFGIYDSYSMDQRSVVSLSGGEKFLVSLALALAMSHTVQLQNGGVQLDAMFIDEGFGTLDEHSIADALAVLQVMTQRQGMVGIISHVEVLKEHIPCGVEVEKLRNGSRVHIRKA